MNGQDLYNMMTSLISNFQMDPTLFLQFINIARGNREMAQPFMRLRKFAALSSLANTGDTYKTAKAMPTDFVSLTDEGKVTLFDGIQTWQVYTEIPFGLQIQYKDQNNIFFIDHANGNLYLCGIVDRTYSIYLPYQADFGDITLATQWINIPKRFHPILALDVAAMYRLGVDYDDINARNADSNAQQAELLFKSMQTWDAKLQRSSVTQMDYPVIGDAPAFIGHKIDMRNG